MIPYALIYIHEAGIDLIATLPSLAACQAFVGRGYACVDLHTLLLLN